jgi:hypothetical protein
MNGDMKKWAARDLLLTTGFFLIGFLVLPPDFFSTDKAFDALLAGLALGVGAARLIKFLMLAKAGMVSQDKPDCM